MPHPLKKLQFLDAQYNSPFCIISFLSKKKKKDFLEGKAELVALLSALFSRTPKGLLEFNCIWAVKRQQPALICPEGYQRTQALFKNSSFYPGQFSLFPSSCVSDFFQLISGPFRVVCSQPSNAQTHLAAGFQVLIVCGRALVYFWRAYNSAAWLSNKQDLFNEQPPPPFLV